MARNLFKELNSAELRREINERVEKEKRSLPPNAKVFAAVAQLQGFDAVPDIIEPAELQKLLDADQPELLRGLTGLKGVSAKVFCGDLLQGAMYPGTLSAIGTGIHFALPSEDFENAVFPKKSIVAWEYAAGAFGGAVVRATIAKERAIDCRKLLEVNREHKMLARKAGISDVGALAAACGIEAFFAERHYDHAAEDIWVVLNRGALTFQNAVLLIKPESSRLNI